MQLKPITAIIVLLLLVISLSVAGCTNTTTSTPSPTGTPIPNVEENNTTYTSPSGFSITVPSSLEIQSSSDLSKLLQMYIHLDKNNTYDGVAVYKEDLKLNETLDQFVAGPVNEIKNYSSTGRYTNFAILNETDSTLAGKPAHIIVWSGIVPAWVTPTDRQNTSVKVMEYFAIYNHVGYIITYNTISDNYNSYLTQAQDIINSFRFTS